MKYALADYRDLTRIRNHRWYNSARGAAIAYGRLDKQNFNHPWCIISEEEFRAANVLMPTKNLLSGKIVMIRKADKGSCCDPGTERYWSM